MFVVALRPVDDDSDRTRRRDRPPADRPAAGARVTVAVSAKGCHAARFDSRQLH